MFSRTEAAHLEQEQAKVELKSFVPEDVHQAIGQRIRAKRSKSGAISFDRLIREIDHASCLCHAGGGDAAYLAPFRWLPEPAKPTGNG